MDKLAPEGMQSARCTARSRVISTNESRGRGFCTLGPTSPTVSQHPLQSNIHRKRRPFYTGTLPFGSIVHSSPEHTLPSLQLFDAPPALATAVAGLDGIFEMDTGLLLFDAPPAVATAVAGLDGIFEMDTGLLLQSLDASPALATAVAGLDGIFEMDTGLLLFDAPPALATAVAGPHAIFEIDTGFLHFDVPPAPATAVAGPDGIFEIDTGLVLLDWPPALPVATIVFRHRIPQ
ncbi:hypothetical protein K438DRAFT_1976386 [Mycena galopus ATCC 62051]|nr:hypothetical protein K438DRAFT_1976386 [Mycena galopus ATCC 62051]